MSGVVAKPTCLPSIEDTVELLKEGVSTDEIKPTSTCGTNRVKIPSSIMVQGDTGEGYTYICYNQVDVPGHTSDISVQCSRPDLCIGESSKVASLTEG